MNKTSRKKQRKEWKDIGGWNLKRLFSRGSKKIRIRTQKTGERTEIIVKDWNR